MFEVLKNVCVFLMFSPFCLAHHILNAHFIFNLFYTYTILFQKELIESVFQGYTVYKPLDPVLWQLNQQMVCQQCYIQKQNIFNISSSINSEA